MEIKTIGLASDHAAFPLKQFVKQYLEEKGIAYKDYGTYTEASCNYADFGHALAEGIEKGEATILSGAASNSSAKWRNMASC